MKIAIDISQIIYGTGVSVYTSELVESLHAIYKKDEFLLFGGSLRRKDELQNFTKKLNTKGLFVPISPTMADFIWNKLHILKIENLIGRVDVVHTSDWAEPPSKIPKVTTIHDFAPLLFPELTHPRILSTHKRKLEWVKKESRAVIVPTSATYEDAVKFGIKENRIYVIPEALKKTIKRADKSEIANTIKKYKIKGKYAICIGNNKRKNTKRIISAFEKTKTKAKLDSLVIVGNGEKHPTASLVFTGHIPDRDLHALYSGAEVLLYPSLYEGFGLPILEAMKCKIPVVTSNISSMAEVSKDAAVLVDPYSLSSISEGIINALHERSQLVKKGEKLISQYSWEKVARQTYKVYQAVA